MYSLCFYPCSKICNFFFFFLLFIYLLLFVQHFFSIQLQFVKEDHSNYCYGNSDHYLSSFCLSCYWIDDHNPQMLLSTDQDICASSPVLPTFSLYDRVQPRNYLVSPQQPFQDAWIKWAGDNGLWYPVGSGERCPGWILPTMHETYSRVNNGIEKLDLCMAEVFEWPLVIFCCYMGMDLDPSRCL